MGILLLTLLIDYKNWHQKIKPSVHYFLMGLIISIGSFSYQYTFLRHLPDIDGAVKSNFIMNLAANWDVHRRQLRLLDEFILNRALFLNLICIVACLLALKNLWKSNRQRTPNGYFLLKLYIISFIVNTFLILSSQLAAPLFPPYLLSLMPGRFYNYNSFIAVTVIFGIFYICKNYYIKGYLFSAIIILLILIYIFMGNQISRFRYLGILLFSAIFIYTIFSLLSFPEIKLKYYKEARKYFSWLSITFLFVFFITASAPLLNISKIRNIFYQKNDSHMNKVFLAAARRKGMLLNSAGIPWVQFLTKRPVVLNFPANIDGFFYVPEAAVHLENTVKNVYGFSIYQNRPEHYWNYEKVFFIHQDYWEKFTLQDWQKIKKNFLAADVLTHGNYKLNLPVIEQNQNYTLYTIPD